MSHKIAKAIRKLLKSEGINYKFVKYEDVSQKVELSKDCGRKIYQDLKKQARLQ